MRLKINNKFYIPIIVSLFIQIYFMKDLISEIYEIPFVSVMPGKEVNSQNIFNLWIGLCYIPIPFILLTFSNDVKELLNGYGKLLVIRNYSKRLLMVRTICKAVLQIGIVVLFTWIVQNVFLTNTGRYSLKVQALSIILYILVFSSLVVLQYIFELFLSAQTANVIINAYIILSLLLWRPIMDISPYLNKILFINLGYINRNGGMSAIYKNMLSSFVILLILAVICTEIFSRKDIL